MTDTPRIRSDLIVTETRESSGDLRYRVKLPGTGESFEFGAAEYFLLQSLDRETSREAISAGFRERFDISVTTEELDGFLAQLAEWGLLKEPERLPTAEPQQPEQESPNDALAADQELMHEVLAGVLDEASPDLEPEESPLPPLPSMASPIPKDHWRWFCPNRLFGFLAEHLRFLRFGVYFLPLGVLIACVTVFRNLPLLVQDLARFWEPVSLLTHLLIGFLTVNLINQITTGIIYRGFGAQVHSFGLRLALGLIPRFDIVPGEIESFSKRHRLWMQASPLLIRLAICSITTPLWLMTRSTGTLLPAGFLTVDTISLVSFLLIANPLMRGAGYHMLCTLLETPDLRRKANQALFRRFFRKGAGAADESSRFALKAYALASLIFLVSVLGLVLLLSARWLELNYQGTGVALFLLLLTFLTLRFRRQIKEKRQQGRQQRQAGVGIGRRGGGRHRGGPEAPPSRYAPKARPAPRIRWLRTLVIGLLLSALFLPYPYETGGPVLITPLKYQEITAETEGLVVEVFAEGGEWLEEHQLLARLSSHEQERTLAVTEASIQTQEARLDKLLTTPLQEQIQVASQELATAKVKLKYSLDDEARLVKLYKKGTISHDEYQDALREKEVDQMQVLEQQAELALVLNTVHPKEVEAARAELDGLRKQLAFYQGQLARTRLVMPFTGQLVTTNLAQKIGSYLDEGELFAVAEDNRSVRVEISVPEADIGEVEIGGATRMQVWTHPGLFFKGRVTEIDPVVTDAAFGKVVRVVAVFPNEERLLKSGMTGFAKIESGTRTVLAAFTRTLVRFVRIEAWSWLP